MTLRGFFVSVAQVAELDGGVAAEFQRLLTAWTDVTWDAPDELKRRQLVDVAVPETVEPDVSG